VTRSRWFAGLFAGAISFVLAGCGGGRGGSSALLPTQALKGAKTAATSVAPTTATATGPGGVKGAALWYPASSYNGTDWVDQSGSGLITIQPNSGAFAGSSFTNPTKLAVDANYNPGVGFNGVNSNLIGSLRVAAFAGANSYMFSVSNAAVVNPTVANFGDVISGVGPTYCCDTGQGIIYYNGTYGDDLGGNHGIGPFTSPAGTSVQSDVFYATAGNGLNASIGENGISVASSLTNAVAPTGTFEIGGRTSNGNPARVFNGSIDEVIYFNSLTSPLTATQLAQIRSYLALKYGITMGFNTQTGVVTPINYVSSAGTTIWSATTNTGFVDDVAGIGADAASGLDQRISHSINAPAAGNTLDVTIANGTSLTTTSQTANAPFTSDQSFVMWGDNGGSATLSTISGINRMARVWRTQVTGTGSTNLTIQVPAAKLSAVTNPSLLIAADANFQTSLQSIPLICSATSCSATVPAFSATAQYFSFGPPAVGFNDYTTFGYDNGRDVFNPNSTTITPATVPNLHVAWTATTPGGDGQSQPILATGISGHRGVLFVSDGNGNVNAYDATTGANIWTKNFGQATYSCFLANGSIGMAGTVAYDPASHSIYAYGNLNSSLTAYAANTLYHLDAATGTVLGSVNVSPTQVGQYEINLAHTAIALNNGVAYVGTSSTCDISSWRGRVAAVNIPAMTLANTFFTTWDPQNAHGFGAASWGGGSVWGWGGVALDPNGNVLTATGNADVGTGSFGTFAAPFVRAPFEYSAYAESVLELSGDLSTVVASNHPNPQSLYSSETDIDVQGTPVVFKPTGCGTMLAGQSKSGALSLYNESSMSSGPFAQFNMGPSGSGSPFLGAPAYSPATNLVYAEVVASESPSLFNPGMIAVNPNCGGTPSVVWQTAFGSANGIRSVPAVSAGGVVFAGTGGSVYALNASNGALLNGGNAVISTGGEYRVPVTIDGNWVFSADQSGNLVALTTDPNYVKSTPANYRRATTSRFVWHERN
jgi:hypothetical protein